ncbi:hypothetical protein [Sphingobium chungbukense]|uniref:PA domain-containing protein n=1 Tax=Sphingobium chungbukense TaxID=56193 RepID=A0A0M3AUX8_9SPHN|nr:hypothetical protein [Sphingobium chungbukense]KKW92691.1 hypothetical protein YP76_07095 [Sphingobium chungbukense]
MRGIILAALLLSMPSAAFAGAKIQFSAYEGPERVQNGDGGTKLRKNDIDWWTTGTPPRKYQVIGFISDKRDENWDGGHAIGSPAVAKQVLAAGGDAVIVLAQDEAGATGGAGSGAILGGFFAMGGSKTQTKMLVVKYIAQ